MVFRMTDGFDVLTVTLNPAVDHMLFVPRLEPGGLNRVERQVRHAGGKGVNVATSLSRAGAAVAATGWLGEENANVFEHHFAAAGIHDAFLRALGASRVNIKVVDAASSAVTELNLPGLRVEAPQVDALRDTIARLSARCRWTVFAGSVPAGCDAGVYRDLITAVDRTHCRVALDASGEALRRGVEAKPDLIKPNRAELSELVGEPVSTTESVAEHAQQLVADGLPCVIVSLGAEGAVFFDGSHRLHAAPPPIGVVSTVGAGDAMLAGFIAAQLRGEHLEQSARRASAFAAIVAQSDGPALPPNADADAMVRRIIVKAVQ